MPCIGMRGHLAHLHKVMLFKVGDCRIYTASGPAEILREGLHEDTFAWGDKPHCDLKSIRFWAPSHGKLVKGYKQASCRPDEIETGWTHVEIAAWPDHPSLLKLEGRIDKRFFWKTGLQLKLMDREQGIILKAMLGALDQTHDDRPCGGRALGLFSLARQAS